MEKENFPIFVFTDPGIDDALALELAIFSSRFKIIGACGVEGNVPSQLASANVARLFELFRVNLPVFQGRTSGVGFGYPYKVHGRNGLGNVRLPRPTLEIRTRKEIGKFLEEKGRFVILSLGPLSEVSALLRSNPHIKTRIVECIVMGGGISRGNVTPYAEFNVYFDPRAAGDVFSSGIPITLIPLNVTERVCLFPTDLKLLVQSKSKPTKVLAKALTLYFDFHDKAHGFRGGYMHDPTAVASILWPNLFEFRRATVQVNTGLGSYRGRTEIRLTRAKNKSSVRIAHSVEADRVRYNILDTLLSPEPESC